VLGCSGYSRPPIELAALRDSWSSTWLPAIYPVHNGGEGATLRSLEINREDGAMEGLLALGGALTRGYRRGRFLLSPAGRPLFARFGLRRGSSPYSLLSWSERRRKDAERTVVVSTWEIESLHAEREEYAAGRHFYFVGPSWAAGTSACRCADGTAAQDKCKERFCRP